MKINNKIKAAVIAGIIAFLMLFTYSCKSNDVYSLVERFISGGTTAFTIDGDLIINKEYLFVNNIIPKEDEKSVPSQIHIKLQGVIEKEKMFYANLTIDDQFSTYICCNNDKLYFEISDSAYIALEFLRIMKVADEDALILFGEEITAADDDKTSYYMSFDVSKFTLDNLKSYFDYCDKFISFKTASVEFDNKAYKITFPSYDEKKELKYEEVLEKVKTRMAMLPKNRSDTVTVIFSGDETASYIDIAGVKDYKSTVYPTFTLDVDINKFKNDKSLVMGENIIPFRYFMETLGYNVGYNEKVNKAYYLSDRGSEIYVEGVIIDDKTYISILELMKKDFELNVKSVGEYVEMEIYFD